MGNEGSVASSVYGLNDSLDRIEERLFRIEDIHLHHQTCFNTDSSILISGKKIYCCADASIITGPVVGLVGCTSACVLLEVDKSVEVTVNIFRSDKYTIGERYVESKTIRISAYSPTSIVLEGLFPGIPYSIYFGGINGIQALDLPAKFVTMNENSSNFKVHTCHLGVSDFTSIADYHPALSKIIEERKKGVGENNYHTVLLGNSVITSRYVESCFKNSWESLNMLDGSEQWLVHISEFEREVREKYRSFFRDRAVSQLCSSGTFLPIGGSGESGRSSVDFILSGIVSAEREAVTSFDAVSSLAGPISHKQTSSTSTGWASKRLRKMQEENVTKSSVMAQVLPATAAAELFNLGQSGYDEIAEKIELQKLLLCLIVSIVRLVYAQYFRQLWDSQFPALKDTEENLQSLLKSVLTLRSKNLKLNRLVDLLSRNQRKYVERFHHADTGTEDAIKSVLVEIQTLKQKVVTNLQSISELGHSQGNWRDPKIISLGIGAYYIVCDIEWSWMDHPLEIKLPMNKPCSIPETSIKKIKELLSDVPTIQENQSGFQNEARCVLCVLPKPTIDPYGEWCESLHSNIFNRNSLRSNISLMSNDFQRIVLELSAWQGRLETRSALIVTAANYSLSTEICYYVNHVATEENKGKPLVLENCLLSRHSVRTIVAGSICSQHEQLYSFLHQRQWLLNQRSAKPATFILDTSQISAFVPPSQRLLANTAWRIAFVPRNISAAPVMTIANPVYFSSFEVERLPCMSPENPVRGIIIEQVTDTSCTILVEASESCSVSLICEDGLTGLQYCMRQNVITGHPTIFFFNELEPRRHYHIFSAHRYAAPRFSEIEIRNDAMVSFTTLCAFSASANSREPSQNVNSTIRLLFLNATNVMESVRSIEATQAFNDSSALIYSVHTGCIWLKKLAAHLCVPWSGIDILVHSRCPIDVPQYLPRITSLLHLAEDQESAGNMKQCEIIRNQAEQTLRDAFRSTLFADSTYGRLFRCGGHFIPRLSLMNIVESCGFEDANSLYRELTPSVCKQLECLLNSVSNDYCSSSWLSSKSATQQDSQDFSFFLAPGVFCYEIVLDISSCLGRDGQIIPPNQLRMLERQLLNNNVDTVVLLAPIPVFEQQNSIASNLSDRLHFMEQDVISLVDVLFAWVQHPPLQANKKSVVILCTSSGCSHPVDIIFDIKEQASTTNSIQLESIRANLSRLITFRQICCHNMFLPFADVVTTDGTTVYQSHRFPYLQIKSVVSNSELCLQESFGYSLEISRHLVKCSVLGSDFPNEAFDEETNLSMKHNFAQLQRGKNLFCILYDPTETSVDPINSSSLADLYQYKDVLDSIFSINIQLVEKHFAKFSDGCYCDSSSNEIGHIYDGLHVLCLDIVHSLDISLQELFGFPSLIGIQLAWSALSQIEKIDSHDSSTVLSCIFTRWSSFVLFIKLALLSRIMLDCICRESQLMD